MIDALQEVVEVLPDIQLARGGLPQGNQRPRGVRSGQRIAEGLDVSAGKMQPVAGGEQLSGLVRVALPEDPPEWRVQREAVLGAGQAAQEQLLFEQPVERQRVVGEEGAERAVDEGCLGDDPQQVERPRRQAVQHFVVEVVLNQRISVQQAAGTLAGRLQREQVQTDTGNPAVALPLQALGGNAAGHVQPRQQQFGLAAGKSQVIAIQHEQVVGQQPAADPPGGSAAGADQPLQVERGGLDQAFEPFVRSGLGAVTVQHDEGIGMPLQGLLHLAGGGPGGEAEQLGEPTAEVPEPARRTVQVQPQ
ncbi:hypothetical protein L4Z13_001335 [Pseudomonas aeruginosa]|nr:hypothetical protein [Pseudomonas aeruginosa]